MTKNQRIILNIIATYARSLYALAIGIFSGRWTLMALGQTDYGLMGVVGGLMFFVSFLNGLMASAVGRFYAFAIGEANKKGNEHIGLDNCRRWFNVALTIHTIVPTILILVGYPIGVWAVENYLVIPPEKITACIWVWRFSCIACFVSMINVPFQAMYTAKQEIAELTIYSFVTTTVNVFIVYYMVSHPGFWLVKFSAWTCFLGIIPQAIICIMALIRFPECKFNPQYLWDGHRVWDITVYAGGLFFCGLAQMFSRQGVAIAVNKLLGPVRNAAMSIGNTVVSHASRLTSSCTGAFYPAITNAAGEGDLATMRSLSFRMCKISTVTTMLFAVPLIAEISNVMILWLKDPPVGSASLCSLILMGNMLTHMTDGHWMAIYACGRVTAFNICESLGFFLGFILSVIMMAYGCDIDAVGYGIILSFAYGNIVKLYYGRKFCGLSIRYWFIRVFLPISMICIASIAIGMIPRLFFAPTFYRILLTTLLSELGMIFMTWFILFEEGERLYVISKVKCKMRFVRDFCGRNAP